MYKAQIIKDTLENLTKPDKSFFEVVERKFRGHPDSLADMVAHRFTQLYIQKAWELFPELENKQFPNFSADKITLSGSSTSIVDDRFYIYKPVNACLIGKITRKIGDTVLNLDEIFERSINEVLAHALNTKDFIPYIVRDIYTATLAGVDHNMGFYNPSSTEALKKILANETHANDTVFVVAYAPLSVAEKLAIFLDNYTYSQTFNSKFDAIGSDIKAMVRRRGDAFDITMCLPVFPEKVNSIKDYETLIKEATSHLYDVIVDYLSKTTNKAYVVNLKTNTKDTKEKKYFAVWGTALSKGDIGAVGRGNRQQGVISGMRPSTNEAMSGKNPNHFAGIIYQLVAEKITNTIYNDLGIENTVYITANNGDVLNTPASIDVLVDSNASVPDERVQGIVNKTLDSISDLRMSYIKDNYFDYFMKPQSYGSYNY